MIKFIKFCIVAKLYYNNAVEVYGEKITISYRDFIRRQLRYFYMQKLEPELYAKISKRV